MEQIAIALTGAVAIFLTQDSRESVRRWACIAGLLGQPWWFMAAIKAGQAGIIFVCILYTAAWFKGFYTYWVMPWVIKKKH